jgi:hypothetical protein
LDERERLIGDLAPTAVDRERETLNQAREVIGAYIDHRPRPATLAPRLQDAARGARHVGRSTGSATENRGLNPQRGKGAVQNPTGRFKQPLVAWFVDDQHRPGTLIEDGVADASEQE